MKLTFEAFARPLFGPRYLGAVRALLVSGIVFFGLRLAGLRWSLPLPTLYLLVTAGTGGILWQSLAAEGRSPNLENPCMLPFSSRTFVFSYVAALGSHTLLTKTVPLLAALLAVSVWPPVALGGSLLCGVHGVLVTAALFVQRTWVVGGLWAAAVAALFPQGEAGEAGAVLTNARQAQAAQAALEALQEARAGLDLGMTPDAVLTDVEAALERLGELTGRAVREDVVDRIFSRFCVGK